MDEIYLNTFVMIHRLPAATRAKSTANQTNNIPHQQLTRVSKNDNPQLQQYNRSRKHNKNKTESSTQTKHQTQTTKMRIAPLSLLLIAASTNALTFHNGKKTLTALKSAVSSEAMTSSSETSLVAGDRDILVRAARGEEVERTPVWLMRQAGRYMAAFREYSDVYPFRHRSEVCLVCFVFVSFFVKKMKGVVMCFVLRGIGF